MQRLTSKTTYSIVFVLVIFFVSIAFYSNKDFYKQYIIDVIYSAIDFKIEFNDSALSVFPSPGITLSQVNINSIEGENKIDADFNSIEFLFSWKILLGDIELNSIKVTGGNIELTGINENLREDSGKKMKSPDLKNLQKIFSFMNLDTLSFHSVKSIYKIEKDFEEEFLINSLKVDSNHESIISIDFDINYKNGNFVSGTKIKFENNDFNFQSLEIESTLKIRNFALLPFKKYYRLIYGANFDNTILNGLVILYKEKSKNDYNIKVGADLSNLQFRGDPIYPIITASSEFTYLHGSNQINFHSIKILYEKGAIASASGTLVFKRDFNLNLNIKGEYVDIYKVVYLIIRLVDIRSKSKINFYSHLNILCAKAEFDLYELRRINLDIDINNVNIGINVHNADVLGGRLSGIGKVVAKDFATYNFNLSLNEINSEEWISKYTKNPYLKGRFSSNLSFQSSGNNLELFLENLISTGKVEIHDGELLGYANILKPIFSLGKLVNVLGPRGKNTEFQSLKLDYSIQKENISVKNLKLLGVGIDAHGGGRVNFKRKIDFRIYAGLGGIAGKALYIPIVYKGVMPDNVSYVDPVWIGSVYVGATLFGGPAGATVGGVAGSAVSEYINRAWEGVKGIFSREATGDSNE